MTPEEFRLKRVVSEAATETHERLQRIERDYDYLRRAIALTQSENTQLRHDFDKFVEEYDKEERVRESLVNNYCSSTNAILARIEKLAAIPVAPPKAPRKRVKPKWVRK